MHCFLSNLFAYTSLFVAMIFTRTAVLEGGDGGGGGGDYQVFKIIKV